MVYIIQVIPEGVQDTHEQVEPAAAEHMENEEEKESRGLTISTCQRPACNLECICFQGAFGAQFRRLALSKHMLSAFLH